jgi:hypothetical protein
MTPRVSPFIALYLLTKALLMRAVRYRVIIPHLGNLADQIKGGKEKSGESSKVKTKMKVKVEVEMEVEDRELER